MNRPFHIIYAILLSILSLSMVSCVDDAPTLYVAEAEPYYQVKDIVLKETSVTLKIGDSKALTYTMSPVNATNKSVSWSSNNTSVAIVSSSGEVTAKAAGTATITVITGDPRSPVVKAVCRVTVASPVLVSGISLNKTSASIPVGGTQSLSATVSPSNAANKNITWSSSNPNVATVSSSGMVTAKSVGSATITATAADHSGVKATCNVSVVVYVSSISLNKTSASILVGDKLVLFATVSPSNATNNDITWSSSNANVATVSTSGVVTAKGVGSATITASAADGSGTKATCTVTVKMGSSIDMEDYGGDGNWN